MVLLWNIYAERITMQNAINEASKKNSIVEALLYITEWEAERAMNQAIATGSKVTMFKHLFKDVLQAYENGD